eukprot:Nitzschia sp. Nitz4//scaffold1_size375055//125694//127202//NITZ4_000250-RA/size375055-processed-gene-0.430-mRNA-1//-1//CDS//3329540967//1428//frame0
MSSVSTYEQFKQPLPSENVIKAIVDLPSNTVIASDVAAKAGIGLAQAKRDLVALASLTKGEISVSEDGELLYEFPHNLRTVLWGNSAKYKAVETFRNWSSTLYGGVRAAFGVTLMVSVFLVMTTLMFAGSASDKEDDRRRGRGNHSRGPGIVFYHDPFSYHSYGFRRHFYHEPQRPNQQQNVVPKGDDSGMGFLDSIFSYVFGDGDPNKDLETKRLQMAAEVIRSNGGAVAAEQLAPFCDVPYPTDSSSVYVDESFVLPIVSQLGGEPEVTSVGDIVYVFPALQQTAAPSRRKGQDEGVFSWLTGNVVSDWFSGSDTSVIDLEPTSMVGEFAPTTGANAKNILLEEELKFSSAPVAYQTMAGVLGGVNLVGVLALKGKMAELAASKVALPGLFGITQRLFPFLTAYAAVFNILPVFRKFWIDRQNAQIRKRNSSRRRWLELLRSRSAEVRRKVSSARDHSVETRTVDKSQTVYSTKKSSRDLEMDIHRIELDEFDELLRNRI